MKTEVVTFSDIVLGPNRPQNSFARFWGTVRWFEPLLLPAGGHCRFRRLPSGSWMPLVKKLYVFETEATGIEFEFENTVPFSRVNTGLAFNHGIEPTPPDKRPGPVKMTYHASFGLCTGADSSIFPAFERWLDIVARIKAWEVEKVRLKLVYYCNQGVGLPFNQNPAPCYVKLTSDIVSNVPVYNWKGSFFTTGTNRYATLSSHIELSGPIYDAEICNDTPPQGVEGDLAVNAEVDVLFIPN